MELTQLQRLALGGESDTVEFKSTTGQLNRAGESLCAFLNSQGGRVLIGVAGNGTLVGQLVSEKTLREVGLMLEKLEPSPPIQVERVALPDSTSQVLVLEAPARADLQPFVFDGRPYTRLGTNTVRMPQEHYQQLLLARAHSRHRWETQVAEGVVIDDLDQEQILRTVRLGLHSAHPRRDFSGILEGSVGVVSQFP